MFSMLLALTLSFILSPIKPALSVNDFRFPEIRHTLPLAEAKSPLAPVKKDAHRLGVETKSRAAAVVDWRTGTLLSGKDAETAYPIASITKLMTALIVLSDIADRSMPVKIFADDLRPSGGSSLIQPDEEMTVDNLLHLTLVASSNDAAAALARATGRSATEFVAKMNATARSFGMEDTIFVEPTGLDANDVASAKDVALLIRQALSSPVIKDIVAQKDYSFEALSGRKHFARSTDNLLDSFLSKPPYTFLGGKTGSLQEAGYCFGAAAQDEEGHRLIAVVLGAPDKDTRFSEVKSLLFWGFDAFSWPAASGK